MSKYTHTVDGGDFVYTKDDSDGCCEWYSCALCGEIIRLELPQ